MTTVQTPATAGTDERDTRDAVRPGRIGLGRLTVIELRKLADTRAGLWLLIVIGLAALGTAVIQLIWSADSDQTLNNFFQFGLLPVSVLLPVLGVLSMTGEWSQRTALTTFTLVPQRGRVVVAKLAAGVLIALLATALTLGLAALANLIAGSHDWKLGAALLGQSALGQVLSVLFGLGFGALLMNSPLAIVTFFALPTVWSILGATIKGLHPVAQWLDFNSASMPLSGTGMTATQWGHLGVASAVWVLVPLAAGTVRVLRREVA
jgi:ABC-type transport system involved in multi-copper enzyme maturation permease subunit